MKGLLLSCLLSAAAAAPIACSGSASDPTDPLSATHEALGADASPEASTAPDAGGPTLVATLPAGSEFTTDGTTLYYDDRSLGWQGVIGGNLYSVPLAGGTTTTVYPAGSSGVMCSTAGPSELWFAGHLRAAAGYFYYLAYFTSCSDVAESQSAQLQGSFSAYAGGTLGDGLELEAHGSSVFYVGRFGAATGFRSLQGTDVTTGTTTTLLADGWPTGDLTVGTRYVIGSNPLQECAKTGCSATTPLFTATGYTYQTGLTAFEGVVYWWGTDAAGHQGIFSCPESGCTTPAFLGPETVTGAALEGLVVRERRMWWLLADGTLTSCPVTGCLASGDVRVAGQVGVSAAQLQAVSGYLYWSLSDGASTTVMRVPHDYR